MQRLTLTILLIIGVQANAQLIVNEFSQGASGQKEYLELLVIGTRTCTDSTVDLRGWIFDDQNGWYGTNSVSQGHYRFSNAAHWAKVPYGSIIVLYNNNEKNSSITVPDDPTDADKDLVYIVPVASPYIEEHTTQPSIPYPSNFIYPTIGYGNSGNTWNFRVGLNNTSDAVIITNPNNRSTAYFSIVYGFTVPPGYQTPTVSLSGGGGGSNYYLTDDQYANSSSWAIGSAGTSANTETPGAPNTPQNAAWTMSMRKVDSAFLPRTSMYVCLQQGQTFDFNGNIISSGGHYNTTYVRPGECDSLVHLYAVVTSSQQENYSGCGSVDYKGNIYYATTVLKDTITSNISGCDSIYKVVNIQVNPVPVTYDTVCVSEGQTYNFNGQVLSTTGSYSTTFSRQNSCDSVVHLYLNVSNTESQTITGCTSVTYDGITYSSSIVLYRTLYSSITGCDSVHRTINIIVHPSSSSNITACINEGNSYNFNGQIITNGGHYIATLQNSAGCDSVVKLYLVVAKQLVQNFSGCNNVFYNGINYATSTVLYDTVQSIITSCDSIYKTINIEIDNNITTNASACINEGQEYNFNGQQLSTTGFYTTTYALPNQCDSTVNLYLVVSETQQEYFTGCDSVRFEGIIFYTSIILKDTTYSLINGCDSIYTIVTIDVVPSSSSHISACISESQTYNLNGQNLNSSGYYSTVYQNFIGCDSIVNLYLVVSKQSVENLSGCSNVVYNGNTYTSSTVLYDTIYSVTSGCDSIYKTIYIEISNNLTTYANVCINEGQTYDFNGQVLTTTGNYTTTFSSGQCDSTVNLYLLVSETKTQNISGCKSVNFNGNSYTYSTLITDTLKSFISGCDSVYYQISIIINHPDTSFSSACIAEGQVYDFNGQVFTSNGFYTTNFTRPAKCDSVVHLNLIVSSTVSETISGCSSVVYNGNIYFSSQRLIDTIKSVLNGCDSIYKKINIEIGSNVTNNIFVCMDEGQFYNFNGQSLTTSGFYTTTYPISNNCDSIVQLYLVFKKTETQFISGCTEVNLNGVTYFNSTQIIDTIKSLISNCDSLYKITNIQINNGDSTFTTHCMQEGQTYNFNGQILNTAGYYSTSFQTASGCDSIVNLYLVVSKSFNDTITGCSAIDYNGNNYTSSTSIQDIIPSIFTGCDSIITNIYINIIPSPQLIITSDTTLCKSKQLMLAANAGDAIINWIGLDSGNTITVHPTTTTTYTAVATNNFGCTDTADVTISIQNFELLITADPNAVSGNTQVNLQTSSTTNYQIIKWLPQNYFQDQTAKHQTFSPSSSTNVTVVGKSDAGCLDTATIFITVNIGGIWIPTAFTPNGDGKNDIFKIIGSDIKYFELQIYNRWGEKIFESNDKSKGWNGNVNGKTQPAGIYIFQLKVSLSDGSMVSKKGTIMLIR